MPLSKTRPIRKQLDHTAHFAGRFGALYFVTICCAARGKNQLCRPQAVDYIFETARRYHQTVRCHLELLLLMPDHLHALIGIAADVELSSVLRDFKRITARSAGVNWQRGFFDHRLRRDESLADKADYILSNPLRAGLSAEGEPWRYVLRSAETEHSAPSFPPGD